jgi:hypothetical protein
MAPLLVTVLGALIVGWRGSRDAHARSWSGVDAIAEHRALLAALSLGRPDVPMPATLVLLPPLGDAPAVDNATVDNATFDSPLVDSVAVDQTG